MPLNLPMLHDRNYMTLKSYRNRILQPSESQQKYFDDSVPDHNKVKLKPRSPKIDEIDWVAQQRKMRLTKRQSSFKKHLTIPQNIEIGEKAKEQIKLVEVYHQIESTKSKSSIHLDIPDFKEKITYQKPEVLTNVFGDQESEQAHEFLNKLVQINHAKNNLVREAMQRRHRSVLTHYETSSMAEHLN